MESYDWLVTPTLAVLAYEVSQPLLRVFMPMHKDASSAEGKPDAAKHGKKGLTPMKKFIFVHNVALCLYSFISFAYVFKAMVDYPGLVYSGDKFFDKIDLWVKLFYWSKYYEFVDTLILIIQRKPVMTLQSFHHAGAVLTMAAAYYTRTDAAVWFVVENSFVHTIMYAYYASSVLGYRWWIKKYITRMQIIQFVIGCIATSPHFFFDNVTTVSKITIFIVQSYTMILMYLFSQFYKAAYKKQKAGAKVEAQTLQQQRSSSPQVAKVRKVD
eukprot:ANDGO_00437.mRNA.1 Elongation of fatty acids protein sre1